MSCRYNCPIIRERNQYINELCGFVVDSLSYLGINDEISESIAYAHEKVSCIDDIDLRTRLIEGIESAKEVIEINTFIQNDAIETFDRVLANFEELNSQTLENCNGEPIIKRNILGKRIIRCASDLE